MGNTRNTRPSALLSLLGVLLIWPYVLTKNVPPRLQIADSDSLSTGQGGERPHVVKRSIQGCGSSFENYCLNQGQCMYLVEADQHHCKCEKGYYGARCAIPELVAQPMTEEKITLIIFCVSLLLIGLSGTLYFCCKWWKKNRFPVQQKRHGYKGVQTA